MTGSADFLIDLEAPPHGLGVQCRQSAVVRPVQLLGADVVLVARGDGSRRYCGRGGADRPSALRQGPRGLARGPHLYSFRDEPLQRGRPAASFRGPRQVRSKSGTRAKRSERDERTGCARQLKRVKAFCFLPGCRRSRAVDSLPLPAAKLLYLASGRSRRRAVGRRKRFPAYIPHAKTAGGFLAAC